MNKQDRKDLTAALAKVDEVLEEIRRLAESEQEKFDNLPEALQSGEQGQALEEAAYALDTAADQLETTLDEIRDLSTA